MDKIKWIKNTMPKTADLSLKVMDETEVMKARGFHQTIPGYERTPLANLDHMASYLGLKELYVKDESYRFGLNAFKVLGGSFAMARYIAQKTNRDVSELDFETLTSDKLRQEFGQATFFTATDGNHGRGVAWAANRLKQKAVVYMPKGSTQTRITSRQKALLLLLKRLTTTNVFVWPLQQLQRLRTVLLYRILPGKAMKRSLPGLCRVTARWRWRPAIS